MDFVNRNNAQTPQARPAVGAPISSSKKSWKDNPTWLRMLWLVLLFSGTILLAGLVVLMFFGNSSEVDKVDKNRNQAVFLTNGQVYFGKIKAVNDKYVDIRGIYYLNVSQQVQPNQDNQKQNNVSLVKLGCELHGPLDQMVINRAQVTFWENLKDDGQVSTAISKWLQQNPNGQKCTTAATSTTP